MEGHLKHMKEITYQLSAVGALITQENQMHGKTFGESIYLIVIQL